MPQGKVLSNIFSKWAKGKHCQMILGSYCVGEEGNNGLVGIHSSKFNPLNSSVPMQLLSCISFGRLWWGIPLASKANFKENYFPAKKLIVLSKPSFLLKFKRTHVLFDGYVSFWMKVKKNLASFWWPYLMACSFKEWYFASLNYIMEPD